jgi:hypothetical protein
MASAATRGSEARDACGAVLHGIAKMGKYGWAGMKDLSASTCDLQCSCARPVAKRAAAVTASKVR